MIYSNKNSIQTEAVALFGADADNFLAENEIELFEDAIVIGENAYDAVQAEAFLMENGINLYDDHIVLEGQQAEEYKARKVKQMLDAKAAEKERMKRRGRTNLGYKKTYYNKEDSDRMSKAMNKTHSEIDKRREKLSDAIDVAKVHKDLNKTGLNKNGYSKSVDELKNAKKSSDNASKHMIDGYDAVNRHMRRHPKQYKESASLFDFDLK